MTALTQEIAVKQMQEELRDVRQTILLLGETVATHRKEAVEDRALVVQLGELVNKLTMEKAVKTNARQTRK